MKLLTKAKEQFTPLGNLVLLREIKYSQKGTVLMPETFKPSQPRAEVIAVGEGHLLADGTRVAPKLKAGDVVLINGPVMGIELEGEDRLMICEYGQIAGVITRA